MQKIKIICQKVKYIYLLSKLLCSYKISTKTNLLCRLHESIGRFDVDIQYLQQKIIIIKNIKNVNNYIILTKNTKFKFYVKIPKRKLNIFLIFNSYIKNKLFLDFNYYYLVELFEFVVGEWICWQCHNTNPCYQV